jgi:acyl carrier protein
MATLRPRRTQNTPGRRGLFQGSSIGRLVMTASTSGSDETLSVVYALLAPFNKRGVDLRPGTRFSEDLNLDSLVVMEFVAAVEDRFDISVPLNLLPDIATVQQLADAVDRIVKTDKG